MRREGGGGEDESGGVRGGRRGGRAGGSRGRTGGKGKIMGDGGWKEGRDEKEMD